MVRVRVRANQADIVIAWLMWPVYQLYATVGRLTCDCLPTIYYTIYYACLADVALTLALALALARTLTLTLTLPLPLSLPLP